MSRRRYPTYRSRKFWLVTLVVLLLSGLCWSGALSGGAYTAALVPIVLAYLGANVTQKWLLPENTETEDV